MRLTDLVTTSNAVASVSSRLAKISHLAALLSQLTPDEVDIAIPYLSGETRQGRLGIGGALIRQARDVPPAGTPTLSLHDVDAVFAQLKGLTGAGSTGRRRELLRDLMARATSEEQDFLVRLLFGELRQGALEGVLLDAVARAGSIPAARVRRAAMLAGSLAPVARAALEKGESGLAPFSLQVFRPVQPMLADSAEDIEDAVTELGDAALEYKLDGARIQVHKSGDDVAVYSRALRPVTGAVPEVVEAVRALPARELILDGEVIAFRPDGTPRPFQETMRRFGRRLDVEALRRELPLSPVFFDLLHADGGDLLDAPQAERFDALRALVPAPLVIPHLISPGATDAADFLHAALNQGHEGVMAKARRSPYSAGSRGSAWLKVKAVRTLDLVVLAAEWGSGRRRGWLSNLHLGARDPEHNSFVMLGKTFKGLTDAMLEWQTQKLLSLEIGRDEWTVYVRPELVVEIAFNDIQTSPHYP
ncbi:MAG TPA: ATP-dependent DNA ligase, partial [Vicinamibacterales bacterium]